jgi:hypothetical protein
MACRAIISARYLPIRLGILMPGLRRHTAKDERLKERQANGGAGWKDHEPLLDQMELPW